MYTQVGGQTLALDLVYIYSQGYTLSISCARAPAQYLPNRGTMYEYRATLYTHTHTRIHLSIHTPQHAKYPTGPTAVNLFKLESPRTSLL